MVLSAIDGQGTVHEESDKKMDANDERMEHTQQQRDSSGTSRRTFLTAAALAPVAATVAGRSVGSLASGSVSGSSVPWRTGASSGPIKIGLLEDRAGNFSIFGIPKLHAAQLAVAEINAGYTLADSKGGLDVFGKDTSRPPTETIHGVKNSGGAMGSTKIVYDEEPDILVKSGDRGVLGRKLTLIAPDPQSDNTRFQSLGRRLVEQDNVDVLFAGFASAEREAIRPVMDSLHQLYFYNNQYEGGVADSYTFCTGAVPEQQIIPMMQYMTVTFGPTFYILAADYNFGQLSAAWSRAMAPILGAKMIGQEFIPLSVSQFSSTISKVQQAKPDWLIMYITGQNHANFYPQANAAGLHKPMGSSINMAQGYEHLRFKPPALWQMHTTTNWMEEYQTPRAKKFIQRYRKMFPNESYIAQETQTTYLAIHLYAKAVRKAGTTDQGKVAAALESGMGMEAPEGPVFMDPATHHLTHEIRLARAEKDHSITFVHTWQAIEPWWTRRLGVNLVRNPEHKQYTPADDPYFKEATKSKA